MNELALFAGSGGGILGGHAQLALERTKAAIGYFGDARIENTLPPDALVVPCEYIQAMNWSEC
ncbi:hypothetical protein [Pseudomonas sp. PSPC3-3]|uniref:hypothetical protein n=1 Tax=unclassified Pseudomonas TaxID=196821 RepID=UPI003CE6E79E